MVQLPWKHWQRQTGGAHGLDARLSAGAGPSFQLKPGGVPSDSDIQVMVPTAKRGNAKPDAEKGRAEPNESR